jgi:hypothetical protein
VNEKTSSCFGAPRHGPFPRAEELGDEAGDSGRTRKRQRLKARETSMRSDPDIGLWYAVVILQIHAFASGSRRGLRAIGGDTIDGRSAEAWKASDTSEMAAD